ncbi:hypothetical protein CONPUDRAFT_156820 [Coniophora puteana RWD-64-598 SS2]|uniref:DUF6533 domain-containing protein n=1 Tax=Coniophora puteana (strain RWD-64-598) TaxID=741705 RepID=A0A5M3MF03_CONPW|nr:uncharacterized protein CONPUDRAFT_156820 [Coniophora puteana RWD-64-598 SS2]EIW77617.1 hypothetical protein CONPUDRAFT_156820 [Coniophora puteana RWD-64-598 SS2]
MSDSLSDAEYVYFLQTGYGALAVFAIVVYDYTLTLSREVDLIWKRRWTLVTWLYAISRYYAMILSLFITILSVHTPPMSLMTWVLLVF